MSHAITPTDRRERHPLTRTTDVLQVLRAGGTVLADRGLLKLLDRDGNIVPAWQTAIKNAQRRMELSK